MVDIFGEMQDRNMLFESIVGVILERGVMVKFVWDIIKDKDYFRDNYFVVLEVNWGEIKQKVF